MGIEYCTVEDERYPNTLKKITDRPVLLYYRGNIEIINERAFEYCKSLKQITIPSTVRLIDTKAFKDCSRLERVNIVSLDTYIRWDVFDGCIFKYKK